VQQDPEEWHYCCPDEVFARAVPEGHLLNFGTYDAKEKALTRPQWTGLSCKYMCLAADNIVLSVLVHVPKVKMSLQGGD
jgi:hypothetical protein